MSDDSITKIEGRIAGKAVAIFCGIHGNERVGMLAMEELKRELFVTAGTVYLVFANPPAIGKRVRSIDKNLNRLFSRDNVGDKYEDRRATKLMDLLDQCDALLDIHSYNSESGDQFAISEEPGLELVSKMDFPIAASGFSRLGNGTDAYMHKRGKVGICIECGTTNRAEMFRELAVNSAYQFLQYFDCVEKKIEYNHVRQRRLVVDRLISKTSSDFKFIRPFVDFEALSDGEIFATDGDVKYKAVKNECVIFPRPNTDIGGDACIIGRFID